ncbi:Response regulator receiver domain protein,transcriptional regulatory protein [Shewanella psychrophila]|uniref:Response regulator receiver domain protein,transcriptional regulatory protein n=1 Tax=Shewanella psychrophila TaxID=225848 RepID=A0A1S6HXB4_9GAMM|nr:response regulator [Shewanella psychrophila]AQS40058.1 Response regulator receiver domain protein,transcriptional regulatory protein [Shewanella psychrophila]
MYISFDEFSINIQQLELIIKQQSIPIDERICLLLRLLIENYPSHCSKQLCLESIWPDTVVSDMSLSKLVSDARKIFKQAGCEVAIIQTVHGRGYRLSQELGRQLANQQLTPVTATLASETYVTDRLTDDRKADNTSLKSNFTGIRQKLDKLAHEWPRVSTILFSIAVSFIVLYALLSTHSFDRYLTASHEGHSVVDEKAIVYSESADAIGRVLWIDDHPENNSREREFLRGKNIGVYSTTSSREALLLISLYQYDVIISDMGREEDAIAGLKLLEKMRSQGVEIPFYIYTLNATDELIAKIASSGGQGVAVDSEGLFRQVMTHFDTE